MTADPADQTARQLFLGALAFILFLFCLACALWLAGAILDAVGLWDSFTVEGGRGAVGDG